MWARRLLEASALLVTFSRSLEVHPFPLALIRVSVVGVVGNTTDTEYYVLCTCLSAEKRLMSR